MASLFLLWDGASASPPEGFTYNSDFVNRVIRIITSGAVGTGGSDTEHTHTTNVLTLGASSTTVLSNMGTRDVWLSLSSHTHFIGSLDDTLGCDTASTTQLPECRSIVVITANLGEALRNLPKGVLALFEQNLLPNNDWEDSNPLYANEFLRGSATALTSSGAADHHHHTSGHTGMRSLNVTKPPIGTSVAYAFDDHEHATLGEALSTETNDMSSYTFCMFKTLRQTIVPRDMIALFSAAPSDTTNWQILSAAAYDDKQIKIVPITTAPGTASTVALTHTHDTTTTNFDVCDYSADGGNVGSGYTFSRPTHVHTSSTITWDTASVEPAYRTTYLARFIGEESGNLAIYTIDKSAEGRAFIKTSTYPTNLNKATRASTFMNTIFEESVPTEPTPPER